MNIAEAALTCSADEAGQVSDKTLRLPKGGAKRIAIVINDDRAAGKERAPEATSRPKAAVAGILDDNVNTMTLTQGKELADKIEESVSSLDPLGGTLAACGGDGIVGARHGKPQGPYGAAHDPVPKGAPHSRLCDVEVGGTKTIDRNSDA